MSESDIAQKEAQAGERLQKARRDFDALKKEEAEYLKDRELKAQALVGRILSQAENALITLEALAAEASVKVKSVREGSRAFERGLFSVLNRAEKTVEAAGKVEGRVRKALANVEDINRTLAERTAELATLEKSVKERQDSVEKKATEADKKLADAKDLAYWHKTGKRYKQVTS